MSSRTSTSNPERTAPRSSRFRPALPWLLSALLLILLVTVVRFRTTDSHAMVRVKTAPQVWTFVAPKLAEIDAGLPLGAIYAGAVVLTLAGAFALIWATGLQARRRPPSTRSFAEAAADTPEATFPPSVAWRACSRALRADAASPEKTVVGRRAVVAGMAAVGLVAAWRLGAFTFEAALTGLPDGLASVDHPFHVVRAEALRRSLADGEILRWMASHQGGYPAEFYPFGFAYGVVLLWGMLLGTLHMAVVHKLAVIALFLTPAIVYRTLASRDGLPPLVALSSFVLHISIPGGFWHGGYSELIYMGLVANVSAALAVVITLGQLLAAMSGRNRRAIAWAALAAGAAIWCNPRSAFGLVACGLGAWIAVALRTRTWPAIRMATLRLAAVAVLAALLAAPELVSLLRFGHLYYFLHYTAYFSSTDYLAAMIEAVSLPVFPLVIAGLLTAFMVPADRVATRSAAFAVLLYIGITIVFSFGGDVSRLVQQLETTRLMPVQRFLMIYLAAVGLHAVSVVVAAHASSRWRTEWLQLGFIAAVFAAYLAPSALVPEDVAPPSRLVRSSSPEMESFERAVQAAAAVARQGTTILVAGTNLSEHQQLWAPMVSDRLFFYDSWMWSWHRRHEGPYESHMAWEYDPDRMHEVFSREYFEAHGVGAVIATGEWDVGARATPDLLPVRIPDAAHTPYLVTEPAAVATIAGRIPGAVDLANHRIGVRDQKASGDLVVRQNWFPRWQADVNGKRVPIQQTADGYMRIPLPPGPVEVTLEYALQPHDIAARAAAGLGLGLAVLLAAPRFRKRDGLPARSELKKSLRSAKTV